MGVKIGINGFGRIGKLVFRHSFSYSDIDVIVVNDLMDINTLAYLLKYDTVHGPFKHDVSIVDEHKLKINGHDVFYYSEKCPSNIPWERHDVNYIIESSGKFTKEEDLKKHFREGIERIILSCPPTGKIDKCVVIGVNEKEINKSHKIISNTSCTTNCIAPVLMVLDNNFGINSCFINTVHPYTNNQSIIDAPHKDLRRSRAAAANIIPTTTTAIKVVIKIMPQLTNKFDGIATRVPLIDGALIELTALLNNDTTPENINNLMKEAAGSYLKGVMEYTYDPIVSSDIINNPHSVIFDGLSTKVLNHKLVQLVLWYDNEFAYSKRLVELILILGKQDKLI